MIYYWIYYFLTILWNSWEALWLVSSGLLTWQHSAGGSSEGPSWDTGMAGFPYPGGLHLPLSVAVHHSMPVMFSFIVVRALQEEESRIFTSSYGSLWRGYSVSSTAVSCSNLCGRRNLHKDINSRRHGLLGSDTIRGLFSKNKQQTIRGWTKLGVVWVEEAGILVNEIISHTAGPCIKAEMRVIGQGLVKNRLQVYWILWILPPPSLSSVHQSPIPSCCECWLITVHSCPLSLGNCLWLDRSCQGGYVPHAWLLGRGYKRLAPCLWVALTQWCIFINWSSPVGAISRWDGILASCSPCPVLLPLLPISWEHSQLCF